VLDLAPRRGRHLRSSSSSARARLGLSYDGLTGAFIDVFASGGGLDGPRGLDIGPDGNLYVANLEGNNVLRYDRSTGAFIDVFAAANTHGASSVDGNLYGRDTDGAASTGRPAPPMSS
jgi:streptogramin lyase